MTRRKFWVTSVPDLSYHHNTTPQSKAYYHTGEKSSNKPEVLTICIGLVTLGDFFPVSCDRNKFGAVIWSSRKCLVLD